MKIDYSIAQNLLNVLWIWLSTSMVASASEDKIFQLINERLSHMEAVALYKSKNKIPVEDLIREQVVIENAVTAAAEQGLVNISIETFFKAQIAVSKAIQYRSIADWISEPATENIPDLVNEIRPTLTRLGDEIIVALAKFLDDDNIIQEEQRTSFHKAITVTNLSAADKDQLFNSLLLIRAKSAR